MIKKIKKAIKGKSSQYIVSLKSFNNKFNLLLDQVIIDGVGVHVVHGDLGRKAANTHHM